MKARTSTRTWRREAGVSFLCLLAALCVLYSRPLGDGEGMRAGRTGGAGKESSTAGPGKEAGREPITTVEESILGKAEIATADGARYVALDRTSGRWALLDPGSAPAAKAGDGGRPVPLSAEAPLKLVFHPFFVAGSCIHALIRSTGTGEVSWKASDGTRGRADLHHDVSLLPLTCPAMEQEQATHPYRLMLSLPDERTRAGSPGLLGLWVSPPGAAIPPQPPGLVKCETGRGWSMEPGRKLIFPVMILPGSRLEMSARGKGAADVAVHLRYDPDRHVELPAAQGTALEQVHGSWALPVDHPAPAQIEVSLPSGADGGICLDELGLRSKNFAPPVAGERRNVEGVVIVLIDTLRADRLGFINPSSRVATPRLASLAQESVVFTNTMASSHYTKPSVGTILTGLYPRFHGGLPRSARILSSVTLLPERLKKAGIDTQGIFSNYFLNNKKFGFVRGWNYHVNVNSFKASVGGEVVVDQVRKWAEAWSPGGPFFIYVHLMDPHAPYAPPPGFMKLYIGNPMAKGRFLPLGTAEFIKQVRRGEVAAPSKSELELLRSLYDADVAHADSVVGGVLDILGGAGILDRALLIVTSDHGEEFMEHGSLGHGTNLQRELLHVPLLVHWPGGSRRGTVETTVGNIDLAPTVLDVLDIPKPSSMSHGRSLMELLEGSKGGWRKRAYLAEHWNGSEKAVIAGRWKLITGWKKPVLLFVDKDADRALDVSRYPIAWRYLRQRLAGLETGGSGDVYSATEEVELDEEELEQLRALGYIF